MNILLTGSSGYLGRVLLPILLKRGHNVFSRDLGIFDGDIHSVDLSTDSYSRIFYPSLFKEQIDVVIHLAGISNDPSSELDPSLTQRMNIDASKRLIDFSVMHGINKFIFASSASVYGANDSLVTEDSKLNPLSLYAKSKVEVENYLKDCKEINPSILRFGTLYGVSPKMRFDIAVNLMVKDAVTNGVIKVFGHGDQFRPFLHVADAAKAITDVMQHFTYKDGTDTVYNVANFNTRINSLAECISSIIPSKIEYLSQDSPDKRNYKMDCSKYNEIYGTGKNFIDGVVELKDWVEEHKPYLDDYIYYTIQSWKKFMEKNSL